MQTRIQARACKHARQTHMHTRKMSRLDRRRFLPPSTDTNKTVVSQTTNIKPALKATLGRLGIDPFH